MKSRDREEATESTTTGEGMYQTAPTLKGLFPARDGTPIYYEVSGEGPPLIFCYGLLCRRDHWRHQIRHYADRYRIITFDYRGHNASGVPRNDRHITLEWCARDVEDLMNYLKIEDAVCLGHSLGVPVLVHAALLLKKRMRGMVLVCGSVYNPFQHMLYTHRLMPVYRATSKLFEHFPDAYARIFRSVTQTKLTRFMILQLGFNPETALDEDVDGYLAGVNSSPLATFYALLSDYTSVDRRKLLPKVKQPTLVLAGDEDCVTPLHVQEEMARLLPHAHFDVIHQGSHNAHSDFPDVCNDRIDQFLERIEYR